MHNCIPHCVHHCQANWIQTAFSKKPNTMHQITGNRYMPKHWRKYILIPCCQRITSCISCAVIWSSRKTLQTISMLVKNVFWTLLYPKFSHCSMAILPQVKCTVCRGEYYLHNSTSLKIIGCPLVLIILLASINTRSQIPSSRRFTVLYNSLWFRYPIIA